ncbi:MAG: hypothetical protein ACKOYM_01610 [Actinomycetes bacterium]
MQIVSALFIADYTMHPGSPTRIDLSGVHFSAVAPGPFPCTVEPHLMVLLRNGEGERPDAALEVTFHLVGDAAAGVENTQVARNVQPVSVEPGRFAFRLVRAELTYPTTGTVEARVRIDLGDPIVVPYTLLPPVDPTA